MFSSTNTPTTHSSVSPCLLTTHPTVLSILAACTADIRQWYLQNGLQLKTDKSEALIIGTANQLRTANSAITSVADEIKVLGVVLDRRLAFDKHVLAVTRSCNFRAQAIRHIRHLLSTDLAHTLACSLILTRLDYCNSVLYGAPVSSIQKLQRVQNNAARIVLQTPRRPHAKPLMRQLRFAKSVRANGWMSSGVAVERSVRALTRRLMRWQRYGGPDVFSRVCQHRHLVVNSVLNRQPM